MLLAATTGLAATAVAAGLLTADTPVVVVALVAVLSGVARSVGLTGYTTLGLSDVPPELMRDANALASTVQQLFSGLGVAAATVALRVGRRARRPAARPRRRGHRLHRGLRPARPGGAGQRGRRAAPAPQRRRGARRGAGALGGPCQSS